MPLDFVTGPRDRRTQMEQKSHSSGNERKVVFKWQHNYKEPEYSVVTWIGMRTPLCQSWIVGKPVLGPTYWSSVFSHCPLWTSDPGSANPILVIVCQRIKWLATGWINIRLTPTILVHESPSEMLLTWVATWKWRYVENTQPHVPKFGP